MRTERDCYEVMDMLKPLLERIVKDLGDMGIGLAINSDGGQVVLYEQDKGVAYEHHMRLNEEMTAFGHQVVHASQDIDEFHEEIDRRFDRLNAEQYGSYVGVLQ